MSNSYANNITRLCELAMQAYAKQLGLTQVVPNSILAGFDDEDQVPTPRLVFSCESAEPNGPADDATWTCTLEIQVTSNADDRTKNQHHDFASEIFSQFMVGRYSLPDLITAAAAANNPPVQFTCFDILPGSQMQVIQDRKWVSSMVFSVICCGTETPIPVQTTLTDPVLTISADSVGEDVLLAFSSVDALATGLVLERMITGEASWTTFTIDGNPGSYEDTGVLTSLTDDYVIQYRVKAVNSEAVSGYSNIVCTLPVQGQYKLLSWYKGDELTADDYVQQWNDRRWLANHLVQASASLWPFCYSTGQGNPNGKKFARFSGGGTGTSQTGKRLLKAVYNYDNTDFDPLGTGLFTMFVVFRRTSLMPGVGGGGLTLSDKYLVRHTPGTRGMYVRCIDSALDANNQFTASPDEGGIFGDPHPKRNGYDTDWHWAVMTRDGVFNKLYFDGVFVEQYSSNTFAVITSLMFGGTENLAQFFWGDIAEVAMWQRVVSVDALTTYVGREYAL